MLVLGHMHAFAMSSHFLYTPYAASVLAVFAPLIIAAALWTVILKGFALWYSARGQQKVWFIVLLIVNTLGILEIIYLLFFRKKSHRAPAAPETSSTEADAPAQQQKQ